MDDELDDVQDKLATVLADFWLTRCLPPAGVELNKCWMKHYVRPDELGFGDYLEQDGQKRRVVVSLSIEDVN